MKDLIGRLEEAGEGSRELDDAIATAIWGEPKPSGKAGDAKVLVWWHNGVGRSVSPQFTESVDAAITLIPEGWRAQIVIGHSFDGDRRYCHCTLDHDADTVGRDLRPGEPFEVEAANRPKTALAVCIAALSARAAEETP